MFHPISLPRHSPWSSQVLVIRALFKREIATRFGEYQLGFVWMLIEPLLSVLVIGVLLGSLAGHTVPDIPFPFFVLHGKLLLNLFTGPMDTSMSALRANKGLLIYPSVRPLDPFLARYFYELLTTLFSFAVFTGVGMWMGIEISLGQLHVLAACYLLTWMMGCGMGLIFAVAAAHYKELEKVIDVVLAPLVFVSAVMFPVFALPTSLQQILLWNPLVHPIEQARKALFPFYHASDTGLFYPFAVAVITLGIGLMLFHSNRNFLTQQQ
jgi:capsular polysaccharide transport system permease protein